MGIFINRGNLDFTEALNSEYVDKSGLIAVVNSTLSTRQKFSCVTRCRRFGKSMAAQMLCAYYDASCDSRSLFAGLEIEQEASFEKHLNKYPVLYIDMTDFITRFKSDDNIVSYIDREVRAEIYSVYPDIAAEEDDDLMAVLQRIVLKTGRQFFFIVDEWDAICREFPASSKGMDSYVNWLRRMFKSVSANTVFVGVYMTGILPMKKYDTQSALNNFEEFSMVSPGDMAPYFGFTKEEVEMLAARHGMDFDELEKWYDGYQIGPQPSMFNPNSVMTALRKQWCESYWGRTGGINPVVKYISMNYEGLKDDILQMLAGGCCKVNLRGFSNDVHEVKSRDDVLTVLIHLGYLSYDRVRRQCRVPNLEVSGELENAVMEVKWANIADALQQSEDLLEATIAGDEQAVVCALETAHSNDTSILSYNDENSLACVISIAYYYAQN